MKSVGIVQKLITALILIGISSGLYLYTSGYRIKKNEDKQIDFEKTGMISAKSIPEGANVYLDGKLVTATNSTIQGVSQGLHKLSIIKKGFVEWSKDVEVYTQLVTDITAVLVSQSPRLEPLTNTGARNPVISDSLKQLAYFSTDTEKPGIWIISLVNNLSLFRSKPDLALQDTKFTKYSTGKSIEWSPDEKYLLVMSENDTYYLVDLERNTAETVSDPTKIRNDWNAEIKKIRSDFIDKLEIEDGMKELAKSEKAIWSPDEKKFIYTVQDGIKLQYRVYNLEKPLPIGEKQDNFVIETNAADPQPLINWYSDSFHLIIVEGDIAKENRGTISMIRIDGTNKVEIYNNTLFSNSAYSAPGGDKIIILTTFKSGSQTDLYTIGIR